jgi:hypothetical protein
MAAIDDLNSRRWTASLVKLLDVKPVVVSRQR